jgi:transcriptional regulator with XRE-family HTH domain
MDRSIAIIGTTPGATEGAKRLVPRQRTACVSEVGIDAVKLSRVGDSWDHDRFREYVMNAAANAGYDIDSVADFGRAVDITRAPISKWFRGHEKPSVENLRKIATALKVPLPELLVVAGRNEEGELSPYQGPPAVRPLVDPLAAEIDRMLAPDSPIPAETQARLRTSLEVLVEGHRKWLPKRRQGHRTG